MDNQLQNFSNPEFGTIRTLLINGEPWFVAADVCRALEINNASQALTRLDNDEKTTIILNEGNTGAVSDGWIKNEVNIVNEPGLYRLIFASRKPEALKFQRWVYHEVLPSIRKTGGYQVSGAVLPSQKLVLSGNSIVALKGIIEALGVKPGIAVSKAISMVEKADNIDLSDVRAVLPAAEHDIGYFTPTQISQVTEFEGPRAVNLRLAELNLQYRQGSKWVPTEEGKKYGEYFPYTNNGHSDYQWRWSEKIFELLEDEE